MVHAEIAEKKKRRRGVAVAAQPLANSYDAFWAAQE